MRILIQLPKLMRIYALPDQDPQPCRKDTYFIDIVDNGHIKNTEVVVILPRVSCLSVMVLVVQISAFGLYPELVPLPNLPVNFTPS